MTRRERGSQRKPGPTRGAGRIQPGTARPTRGRAENRRGRVQTQVTSSRPHHDHAATQPGAARPSHARGRAKPQPSATRQEQRRSHSPASAAVRFEARPTDERALEQCLRSEQPLQVGDWLWTMREGAERDLIEELLRYEKTALQPRRLSAALVASSRAPLDADARLDVTFARQGFLVTHIARAEAIAELAASLAPALHACLRGEKRYALQVFVPDSTAGNPLATRAEALDQALALHEASDAERIPDADLRRHGGVLIQICLLSHTTAALGCTPSDRALSLWPGGRARMKLAGDFPSRAARKLAEAFAWLGMAPGSGETCVDLGAAPGGWSWLLLERKARVIAVDPARLEPKLMQNSRLRHVQGSAFDFTPEQPVDWLLCDMAWRPLEVAQMLGRWARQRHTRMLVANFKLPMKRKVEMLERLRAVLSASGFASIRMRQLYHDREEITLTAHVR